MQKTSSLFCANANFVTALFVIDTPFAWIFILGGFGSLATYVLQLGAEMYDAYQAAKRK